MCSKESLTKKMPQKVEELPNGEGRGKLHKQKKSIIQIVNFLRLGGNLNASVEQKIINK